MNPAIVHAKSKKAPACVDDRTIQAMQIRIAQTELMVAGLSCRQYEQWASTSNTVRYNEFVTRYRPVLMDDGHRVLKRFFPTEQRLNDYLTRLANEAQLRGNVNMAIFCTQASKIYDDVLSGSAVQFASYSASLPMSDRHGHQPCNPPAVLPVAAAAPSAPSPTAGPTIATVIAANGATQDASMQPVPDVSMRPAVKKPPTPVLKPKNL
jgi:hypothetical protein